MSNHDLIAINVFCKRKVCFWDITHAFNKVNVLFTANIALHCMFANLHVYIAAITQKEESSFYTAIFNKFGYHLCFWCIECNRVEDMYFVVSYFFTNKKTNCSFTLLFIDANMLVKLRLR